MSSHSSPAPATGLLLLVIWVLGVLFYHPEARAHELAIDQVSLWPDAARRRLRGQVSFDPELTRDLDKPLPAAVAERRVLDFLQRQLTIEIDGQRCQAQFEVRELYKRGGAVPGDIVMLDCGLPSSARQLVVRVGGEFSPIAVTIAGFSGSADDSGSGRQSVLVEPGTASPTYFIERASSEQWRAGGAEQFAPPAPSASTSSTTAADAGRSRAPGTLSTSGAGQAIETRRPGFAEPNPSKVVARYLWIGFTHILPKGWDHVLFVAGLALGAGRRFRRLVLELSLFTLAHTLTLALGALDMIMIAPHIIEPLIAGSIGYVAAENLLGRMASRSRLLIVFIFGLVHGQGFAGALSELALPSASLLSALLGFNLGVEVGQLLVAGCLSAGLLMVQSARWKRGVVQLVSFVSLAVACYWVLERVFG